MISFVILHEGRTHKKMARGGNVHFVRSTQAVSRDVLRVDGVSLWENCGHVFRRIDELCGEGASRIFAEPTVKAQDEGRLVAAWFASYDDDPKQINALDRLTKNRVLADLTARLEALRPALADPEIGETVAAMLNLYDDASIVAAGEHAVLTNWGILPPDVATSQAAFGRHSDEIIGPYLKSGMSPRIPGQPWRIIGGAEPVKNLPPPPPQPQPIAPEQAATSPSGRAIPAVSGMRLWPRLAAAGLLAAALAYLWWPGNLVYEREAAIDPVMATERGAVAEDLLRRIERLDTAIAMSACDAKSAWAEISLAGGGASGTPNSGAATDPQTEAAPPADQDGKAE